MTPQRPALAEVLAVLVGPALRDRWSDALRIGRVVDDGLSVRLRDVETSDEFMATMPWLHDSTAEAVEALATARLWPWEPGDDPTRWWCDRCGCVGAVTARGGRGGQVIRGVRCDCAARSTTREECDRTGEEYVSDLSTPPTLAALVAVASLGARQLARYVALAGEIARAAGCAGARVVWRVMPREAIDAWTRCGDYRVSGEGPVTVTQAACLASVDWGSADRVWGRDYWSGAAPWWLPGAGEVIAYAWPVLRDLAARGVHLVALDASRIVLAVEAL